MPRINRPGAIGYLQETNIDLDNNYAVRSYETDGTSRALVRIDDSDRATFGSAFLELRLLSDQSFIAIADLTATGTPSGTTFLRGDGVWAVP